MYLFSNIRRRGARSVLLVIGVALAIMLTTIMFAISEGINVSTKELIDETNIELFVYPKSSNPILQEFTKYQDLDDGRELAENMREGNPRIRAASPLLVEGLYITTNQIEEENLKNAEEEPLPKVYSITGKGYVPELLGNFGAIEYKAGGELPTASDPFYANGTYDCGFDSDNFTHEVLLNKYLADMLEVTVGDIVYLSGLGLPLIIDNASYSAWLNNASWFKIHGIIIEKYEPASILSASIHLSELQYMTGKHKVNLRGIVKSDFVNEIYIDLYDPDDKKAVKKWLQEDFEDKDKITVLTAEELTSEFNSFMDIFGVFSTMILIITSLVVILFISTIMMISVREQGREIGMLRAIGISKKTVIKYILIESIIICFIGFIIGLISGYIIAGFLEDFFLSTEDEIPVGLRLVAFTPGLILQISFITIFLGILAGITPAIWAAKLTPAESIRKV